MLTSWKYQLGIVFCILSLVFCAGCSSSEKTVDANQSKTISNLASIPVSDYDYSVNSVKTIVNDKICYGTLAYDKDHNYCENDNYIVVDISLRNNHKCYSSKVSDCPLIKRGDFYLEDNTYHTKRTSYEVFSLSGSQMMNSSINQDEAPVPVPFPEFVFSPEQGEVIRGYLVFQIDKNEIDAFAKSSRLVLMKPTMGYSLSESKRDVIFDIPNILDPGIISQNPVKSQAHPSQDVSVTINSLKKFEYGDTRLRVGYDNDVIGKLHWRNIEYVVLDVSLTNNKKTPLEMRNLTYAMKDSMDHYFLRDKIYDTLGGNGPIGQIMEHRMDQWAIIQPGDSIRGEVTFFINKMAPPFTLWVHDGDTYYSAPVSGL